MKKLLFLAVLVGSMLFSYSAQAGYVKGYYRSNGTYVQPYYRTNPDNNFYNNYSTRGNYNPYTGSYGKKTYPTYRSYNYYNSRY